MTKVLLINKVILATEGNYLLKNNSYSVSESHYTKNLCSEVDVELPSDFEIGRYTYENGTFTQTDSYTQEKLNNICLLRASEYPPITDYIDGIVKGDQAQVQTYIDVCLAVKVKYPKP